MIDECQKCGAMNGHFAACPDNPVTFGMPMLSEEKKATDNLIKVLEENLNGVEQHGVVVMEAEMFKKIQTALFFVKEVVGGYWPKS